MKIKKFIFPLVISVILHGILIAGIGIASGGFKTVKKHTDSAVRSEPIDVQFALLPDIRRTGDKSAAKSGTKKSEKIEEFGKSTASHNGQDAVEMLTYKDRIKQKIQEHRKYPERAKENNNEGSVGIVFEVLKDGTTGSVEIISGSGYELLDKEAVDTVLRAAPFPKIPEHFSINKMEMKARIVFKLK